MPLRKLVKPFDQTTSMSVLWELSQAVKAEPNLESYIKKAHLLIAKLMTADNFLLWVYQQSDNSIEFIYQVDERDPDVHSDIKQPLPDPQESTTAWVITHAQELIYIPADSSLDNFWGRGAHPEQWIGMPLKSQGGICIGALVIQSYDSECLFDDQQQALFRLFATLVACAVAKYSRVDEIEQIVLNRTLMLQRELQRETQSDRVQQAIFDIASLTRTHIELNDLYRKVHAIFNTIFDASNILISRYSEADNTLNYAYIVDSDDMEPYLGKTIPMRESMTSYLIARRKGALFDQDSLKAAMATGEIKAVVGNAMFNSWIGAPMISGSNVYGVIILQSYEPEIIYTEADLELLQFVANHVARTLEIHLKTERTLLEQQKITAQHQKIEDQHRHLIEALRHLHSTQQQLLENEKVAALGGLVAGVTHEVNTPLGICITAVSHLLNLDKLFYKKLLDKQLTAANLEKYAGDRLQLGELIALNMRRSGKLMKNFKQMSAVQSSRALQQIELKSYLQKVISSNLSELEMASQQINFICGEIINITTNVDALAQILTQLVANSIKHSQLRSQDVLIDLSLCCQESNISLAYSDNGPGMQEAQLEQLFDPFYTTSRRTGASGLGAHLIYNLVTHSLQGKISASSPQGSGLLIKIQFPQQLHYP
ncbi:MAG: ATP-binding protein [Pseudomonadales bacterium]|nr:ATP-binding protein [Pseudomonadales bacterium]NRA14142.1 GAF domain-containing protein [Oceanospirillaceae bacterium]